MLKEQEELLAAEKRKSPVSWERSLTPDKKNRDDLMDSVVLERMNIVSFRMVRLNYYVFQVPGDQESEDTTVYLSRGICMMHREWMLERKV